MMELASPIKWLIDMLKDFDKRRIQNREERFRAFFEAVFLDLLKIHRNQVEMLRRCEMDLPAFLSLNGAPHKWYAGKDASVLGEQELSVHVERVKRAWQAAREESGGDRVALRAKSAELLRQLEDDIERRFIFAVMNYFIHPEHMYIHSGDIDSTVERLIDRGPDAILDSPSLTVWEQIEHKTDPDKIREVFVTARRNLLARWSEVSERYAELHVHHVSTRG